MRQYLLDPNAIEDHRLLTSDWSLDRTRSILAASGHRGLLRELYRCVIFRGHYFPRRAIAQFYTKRRQVGIAVASRILSIHGRRQATSRRSNDLMAEVLYQAADDRQDQAPTAGIRSPTARQFVRKCE